MKQNRCQLRKSHSMTRALDVAGSPARPRRHFQSLRDPMFTGMVVKPPLLLLVTLWCRRVRIHRTFKLTCRKVIEPNRMTGGNDRRIVAKATIRHARRDLLFAQRVILYPTHVTADATRITARSVTARTPPVRKIGKLGCSNDIQQFAKVPRVIPGHQRPF